MMGCHPESSCPICRRETCITHFSAPLYSGSRIPSGNSRPRKLSFCCRTGIAFQLDMAIFNVLIVQSRSTILGCSFLQLVTLLWELPDFQLEVNLHLCIRIVNFDVETGACSDIVV